MLNSKEGKDAPDEPIAEEWCDEFNEEVKQTDGKVTTTPTEAATHLTNDGGQARADGVEEGDDACGEITAHRADTSASSPGASASCSCPTGMSLQGKQLLLPIGRLAANQIGDVIYNCLDVVLAAVHDIFHLFKVHVLVAGVVAMFLVAFDEFTCMHNIMVSSVTHQLRERCAVGILRLVVGFGTA